MKAEAYARKTEKTSNNAYDFNKTSIIIEIRVVLAQISL